MEDWLIRERRLIGDAATERLRSSCVLIFGLGGVGGAICEGLARAGIGRFVLVDNDRVAPSNLNRQLIATADTVGRLKTEAAAERIRSISPQTEVEEIPTFAGAENIRGIIEDSACDFIADAIDCVSSKIEIIVAAQELGKELISCMGTGNRTLFEGYGIADISKTSGCPLAKAVRTGLRKRGAYHAAALYSKIPAAVPADGVQRTPASISYVPNIAGFTAAEYIIRKLTEGLRAERD